jgi:tRNA threonylcarbamoyladenosine biosynthesis protein TsaE
MGAALWPDALRLNLMRASQEGGQSDARRLTAEVPSAWETRWPPQ